MPFLVQAVFGPESSFCWPDPRNSRERESTEHQRGMPAKAELSKRVRGTAATIPGGQSHTQPSRFYLWLAKNLTFGGRKRVKRTGSEKVKFWVVKNTFSQLMKLKVEGLGH